MPKQIIPPWTIESGRIITAESYFIDRILPDCEVIALPQKTIPGGTLTWEVREIVAEPPKKAGAFRAIHWPQKIAIPKDRVLIDLRDHSPMNWAHFLNNHLPLFFAVVQAAEQDPNRILALLPGNVPRHISEAARLFGLEFMATDGTVEGLGISFDVSPWTALRTVRANWARLPIPASVIDKLINTPAKAPLPKKVFLSRRNTRVLSNSEEIEGLLKKRGYETVYPEFLSPGDQLRLFLSAKEMVAIHGAGLAPLLYLTQNYGLSRLIEILPAGHMTNVYRAMAGQVGCKWVGVRGRLKPEYVRPAYRVGTSFTEFSLDAFEVDPKSLEYAFEMISEI